MRVRTERFYADGDKQVQEGEAHPDVTQDEVRAALRRELNSDFIGIGLTGIRESWIDEDGKHFCIEVGACPAG